MLETRKAVIYGCLSVADTLDTQDEPTLVGEGGYFARHPPRVLTDGERIAAALVDYTQKRTTQESTREHARDKDVEHTR